VQVRSYGYNGRAVAEAEPPFEDAYRQLEEIVRKLEAGGLPLEENLTLFEEGMRLAKLCGRRLDAAELRVMQITTDGAEAGEMPSEQRGASPSP